MYFIAVFTCFIIPITYSCNCACVNQPYLSSCSLSEYHVILSCRSISGFISSCTTLAGERQFKRVATPARQSPYSILSHSHSQRKSPTGIYVVIIMYVVHACFHCLYNCTLFFFFTVVLKMWNNILMNLNRLSRHFWIFARYKWPPLLYSHWCCIIETSDPPSPHCSVLTPQWHQYIRCMLTTAVFSVSGVRLRTVWEHRCR